MKPTYRIRAARGCNFFDYALEVRKWGMWHHLRYSDSIADLEEYMATLHCARLYDESGRQL